MEPLVLSLFCIILIFCISLDVPIVAALLIGLVIFISYGLRKGFSLKELLRMCLEGVKTAKGILTTFILIGMLTAVWRASGCIPSIVCYASSLINARIFVLVTFLLCALISVLTGTAFGTAATMGVICASIASSMGLPPFWIGGAILSGVFFGDRCSPVSTSALLVSSLTGTDIYDNIRGMVKTAAVPFALTCVIYAAAGLSFPSGTAGTDVYGLFSKGFDISFICLIPALLILVLAFFRMSVKKLMGISIAASLPIALFVQNETIPGLIRAMITGYVPAVSELTPMVRGGGITSMIRVACIVSIASCYSGIFKATGLLGFLESFIGKLSQKTGRYPAVLMTAVITSAISCNQTLAIMLTDQLTSSSVSDSRERALSLEDSAVVAAPLIPWSIAGSVPLATVGAPLVCITGACYLYLLPLWRLITSVIRKHK